MASQLNNLEQILCRYRRETYKPQKRGIIIGIIPVNGCKLTTCGER